MSTFHHFALAVPPELCVDGYQQSALVRLGFRPLMIRVLQTRPTMVAVPPEMSSNARKWFILSPATPFRGSWGKRQPVLPLSRR